MNMPKKEWKIWDVFYDRRDDGENHKTTLIAIDNKGRYIVEIDSLPWEVFVEETLDWAKLEEEIDWIDKARSMYWQSYNNSSTAILFREAIEKHMPQQLLPLDIDKILSEIDDIVQLPDEINASNRVKAILAKYGTTQQKKFSRDAIISMFPNNEWSKQDWAIQFAQRIWILEE